jgi:hypothetical protein
MHPFVKIYLAFILFFSECNNLNAQLFALDKNIHLKANIHFVVLDAEEYKNGKPNKNSDKIRLIYEFDKQKNLINLKVYRDTNLIHLINMEYDQYGNVLKEMGTEYRDDKTIKDTLKHNYIYEKNKIILQYSTDTTQIIQYAYNNNGNFSILKYRHIDNTINDHSTFDRIFGSYSNNTYSYYLFGIPAYQNQFEMYLYDSLNNLREVELFNTDSTFGDCVLLTCSLFHYDHKNRLDGIKINSDNEVNYIDFDFNILNQLTVQTDSYDAILTELNLPYRNITDIKTYHYNLFGITKQIEHLTYNKEGELEIQSIFRYKYSYY